MQGYDDDTTGEHVKEVYARFGLAIYCAQVLEHGIVNALIVLDLIPSRRHLARSPEEWGTTVDESTSRHFESTMGRLVRDLQSSSAVPSDLEGLLRDALTKRNWLAHDFFRQRADAFMTESGRERMLREVDECRAAFVTADERLEEIVTPLRHAAGLTDEMLEQVFQEMRNEADRAC
jgi:hypothetical protein